MLLKAGEMLSPAVSAFRAHHEPPAAGRPVVEMKRASREGVSPSSPENSGTTEGCTALSPRESGFPAAGRSGERRR